MARDAQKFDLATGQPVQEWSYGFQTLDYAFEQRDGMQVRVLKRGSTATKSAVKRPGFPEAPICEKELS
jgi:hypothetical protein